MEKLKIKRALEVLAGLYDNSGYGAINGFVTEFDPEAIVPKRLDNQALSTYHHNMVRLTKFAAAKYLANKFSCQAAEELKKDHERMEWLQTNWHLLCNPKSPSFPFKDVNYVYNIRDSIDSVMVKREVHTES